jgi:DNA-binding HxlR family transcriptional regulator
VSDKGGAPLPYDRPVDALAAALERVGDRWSLLLVEALLDGPLRWSELRHRIEGIAPNILSARLKRLEREGVLAASAYSERPVRMVYELTVAGRELAGALRLLAQWGSRSGPGAEPVRHEACGTPVEARWYCPTCDRMVSEAEASDVRMV